MYAKLPQIHVFGRHIYGNQRVQAVPYNSTLVAPARHSYDDRQVSRIQISVPHAAVLHLVTLLTYGIGRRVHEGSDTRGRCAQHVGYTRQEEGTLSHRKAHAKSRVSFDRCFVAAIALRVLLCVNSRGRVSASFREYCRL